MKLPSPARARLAIRKIIWGVQQVGARRVGLGLGRYLLMVARRPAQATVTSHRDRLIISFRFPSQLIPTLVVFGDLMDPELAVLTHALGPGRLAVDVGASIGTWSMMAARTGATVHAYEPDPDNVDVLRGNLRANGLFDAVTIHDVAVGSHRGRVALQLNPRKYLNQVTEVVDVEGIALTTLADVVNDIGASFADVVKVNTAGHEAEVLMGALPLFRDGRIGLAMFLDGIRLREALSVTLADGALDKYSLAVVDGGRAMLVQPASLTTLDLGRLGPMNHYVMLQRRDLAG